jgi:ATP-dependent RNA helicase DeaD
MLRKLYRGLQEDPLTTLFQSLGLKAEILKAIEALGFEEPSPIQKQAIPLLMAGDDIVAQAPTGTGKTAAFAIPIMEKIDPKKRVVQALVLAPTRELAVQVAEASHAIGRNCHVNVLPVYGGQAYDHQLRGLRAGAHLVVGTPGRVLDHIRRGTLQLDAVRFVVLDEADEMLDMGFIDDIQLILDRTPAGRQMALFSATMPPRIQALARKYMRNAQTIAIAHESQAVPLTHQVYYETPPRGKREALTNILDMQEPRSAMIFCRTRSETADLASMLQSRGYGAEAIHGDMSQALRERVLGKFRANKVTFLVATDVAARGLDIPDVSHVINFDIPDDADAYVHRIGRTGRMGRKGEAITLVTPREMRLLRVIEKDIHKKLKPLQLPTSADVAARRVESFKETLRETLRNGADKPYSFIATELAEEFSALQIAAAAVRLAFEAAGGSLTATQSGVLGAVTAADSTRLMLDAGRSRDVRPGDIVKSIAVDAGISGSDVGRIDVQADATFIEIRSSVAKKVLQHASVVRLRKGTATLKLASGQSAPAGSGETSLPPREAGPRYLGAKHAKKGRPPEARDTKRNRPPGARDASRPRPPEARDTSRPRPSKARDTKPGRPAALAGARKRR